MAQSETPGTFCILPWTHVFSEQRGVMYPCCRGLNAQTPNVDENGKPYRIWEIETIDEAWNSGFMKSLRRDLLTEGRPAACESCFLYEDQGAESPRQLWNRLHAAKVPEILATADPSGTAPPVIRSFDVFLGNLCNLRCRMCYPVASKALIREWPELHGVPEDDPELVEARNLDWFEDPGFWKRFEAMTEHVEVIHFAGGEPLLHAQMFDFLERLIASGRASTMSLSYNSNLTIIPDRLFDLWPQFRGVNLVASLDGVGEVNELIRNPSDWSKIDRNLRFVGANADRLNITDLTINTTVQVYNILTLAEVAEYVLSLERFSPYPLLTLLEHPKWLSITILPHELKVEAAARLRAYLERAADRMAVRSESQTRRFVRAVNGIIGHMMQSDHTALIPRFVQTSRTYDRNRGEDVVRTIPELAPLFG